MDTLIVIVRRGSQKRGFLLSKYKMMNLSILIHHIPGNVRVSMLYQLTSPHPWPFEHPSTWIFKVANQRRAGNGNTFKQRCFEYNILSTKHAKRHRSGRDSVISTSSSRIWFHFLIERPTSYIINKLFMEALTICNTSINGLLSNVSSI